MKIGGIALRKTMTSQRYRTVLGPRRKIGKLGGTALVALFCLGILLETASSQRELFEQQRLLSDVSSHRQPPPGTELVFARVRFTGHGPGRRNFGGMNICMPDDTSYPYRVCGWAHDYPDAEEHILQIADEATGINTSKDSYVIVDLGSDEIYKYPIGYFSEVGEMVMNDSEITHMREWLNRGGFGIADDFDGDSLQWFQGQMSKAFPERTFVKLTVDHPVFHTFYDVPTLDTKPPYPQRGNPDYYGMFDVKGRLCFILNHNNDMGDFWEWIDQPEYDLAASTEGLRFGVDYLMYAMTH